MNLFKKQKTGIDALKEKLENANQNLINAVEQMKQAQIVMNDFYKILFEIQSQKELIKDGDNKTME